MMLYIKGIWNGTGSLGGLEAEGRSVVEGALMPMVMGSISYSSISVMELGHGLFLGDEHDECRRMKGRWVIQLKAIK